MSNSGGTAARQKGTARRHPCDANETRSPPKTTPAVYSLANAQPLANPANRTHRRAFNQCPVPPPRCSNWALACLATAQIAIHSRPTTRACENIIVLYGSGAAPRKRPRVVTMECLRPTHCESHATIRPAPSAAMIPIEPRHATQLETSQPASESNGTPATLREMTAAANAGKAKTTVPGAL